ncbi:MAG: hypothetical protein ABIG39_05265 [Candidatus Micrarchaeota archaeon]
MDTKEQILWAVTVILAIVVLSIIPTSILIVLAVPLIVLYLLIFYGLKDLKEKKTTPFWGTVFSSSKRMAILCLIILFFAYPILFPMSVPKCSDALEKQCEEDFYDCTYGPCCHFSKYRSGNMMAQLSNICASAQIFYIWGVSLLLIGISFYVFGKDVTPNEAFRFMKRSVGFRRLFLSLATLSSILGILLLILGPSVRLITSVFVQF